VPYAITLGDFGGKVEHDNITVINSKLHTNIPPMP
jgi:hypothetical protein